MSGFNFEEERNQDDSSDQADFWDIDLGIWPYHQKKYQLVTKYCDTV